MITHSRCTTFKLSINEIDACSLHSFENKIKFDTNLIQI